MNENSYIIDICDDLKIKFLINKEIINLYTLKSVCIVIFYLKLRIK